MFVNVTLRFSGGVGSGKTSLAAAVSVRAGTALASFGRFVRATAEERGITADRENLQALGEALIHELGWEKFCRSVLETADQRANAPLLVDGVRHIAALEHVERLVAPMSTKLVFVDVPKDMRQARLDATRPAEGTVVARADAHSTEKDVHVALRSRADLVLDGTRELDALVAEVCARYFNV